MPGYHICKIFGYVYYGQNKHPKAFPVNLNILVKMAHRNFQSNSHFSDKLKSRYFVRLVWPKNLWKKKDQYQILEQLLIT